MSKEDHKIHFLIDNREMKMIEHLRANYADFQFECANLILGDVQIIIDDKLAYVIERKTYADLFASITDGRYRDQTARLSSLSSDIKVIILVEGDASNINNVILSCFATFTCLGMSIVPIPSVADTCIFVKNLSTKLGSNKPEYNRGGGEISSCLGKNKVCINDPADTYKVILQSIPKLSKNVITSIMTKYPSLSSLNHVSADELAQIKKVGKTTADKIVAIVREIYHPAT
jgi:ERCC4-type nuclease